MQTVPKSSSNNCGHLELFIVNKLSRTRYALSTKNKVSNLINIKDMKSQPELNINRCEKTLSGVKEKAPEVEFGGYKADNFEVKVQEMHDVRDEIESLETQLAAARARRELVDIEGLRVAELIINGIIGNPAYGPDSPLYAAIGRKRKSEHRSGLTRRQKENPAP